jgi:hypothetical protein
VNNLAVYLRMAVTGGLRRNCDSLGYAASWLFSRLAVFKSFLIFSRESRHFKPPTVRGSTTGVELGDAL